MRKNKLYIILAILTSIFFFTTAAICNQCSAAPEEKLGVEETEEEIVEEEVAPEEEEEEEEEVPEEAEEEAEEEATEEEKEAPTIELQIYEGPTYSSLDNVCYYRVKAIVTGTPTPDIEFSKDDSGGTWGSKKAQVNLNDPSDTYNLTATATNSEGTDTDSINLSWGCNRPPEITEITLMGNHYAGLEYTISAVATDPDGDSLTYQWSVEGGSLNNPSANPVKWTMPGTAGNYNITVTVNDGKGGEAERSEVVEVLALSIIDLPQMPEGGFIDEGGWWGIGNTALVGDSAFNYPYRGFLSYDISSLSGKIIVSATMEFNDFFVSGNPASIIEKIWLEAVDWGSGNIQSPGDYSIAGILLGEYEPPTFICSNEKLKNELQKAINAGRDRFQVRLCHKGPKTDFDNFSDYFVYGGTYEVRFNVTYIP